MDDGKREHTPGQTTLLYNRDGVIVRQTDLTDEVVEVELEFLAANFSDAALFSVAAVYVAFHDRLRIDFVPTSYLLVKYALLRNDFNAQAQQTLVRAVLATQEHAARLFRDAERYFYGNDATMETNTSETLRPYQKTDFKGQELGQAFAGYLAEHDVQL